jgi:hypothetical protein
MWNICQNPCKLAVRIVREIRVDMPKTANTNAFSLIRIDTFTAELEWLHLWGTDEEIDREFNSVCLSIWGYTLDDFDDDCLSKEHHAWLDELSLCCAEMPNASEFQLHIFAALAQEERRLISE